MILIYPMNITGRIDEKNQLWVEVTVGKEGSTQQTLECLVDTGFTGEIQLPISVAVPLGLKLIGAASFELADGVGRAKMLFEGDICWGTTTRAVTAIVSPSSTPLLGSGLLSGYELIANFKTKKFSIKEPDSISSTSADF